MRRKGVVFSKMFVLRSMGNTILQELYAVEKFDPSVSLP